LIGQPGVGKTVALAYLASLAANQSEELGDLKDHIPFLVHVADLKLPVSDPRKTLEPILENVWKMRRCSSGDAFRFRGKCLSLRACPAAGGRL